MRNHSNGFAGAVVITILTAGLMLLAAGALLTGCFSESPEPFATGLILFVVFLYLAIAVGTAVDLYQRWKEIRGGEEDEARKY